MHHGKNGRLAYACRDHREGRGCPNKSTLPYREAHEAIIAALRRTFSPESFEAHLANIANDAEARARRDAERANLLVEIPKLAAAESKLAKLVAVTDNVDALVAQLKLTQAERKAAEARVAELEGIELDIRASRDQVEKLKATWGEWSKLLAAHDANLPDGTYGAALARSILRKVLVSPIVVTPMLALPPGFELPKGCDWSGPLGDPSRVPLEVQRRLPVRRRHLWRAIQGRGHGRAGVEQAGPPGLHRDRREL